MQATNVLPKFSSFICNYLKTHCVSINMQPVVRMRKLEFKERFTELWWVWSKAIDWVIYKRHVNPLELFYSNMYMFDIGLRQRASIYSKMIGFVGFYGISTIVGYLMPNLLYTYILNTYDLVWLGFMVYQPL